MGDPLRMVVLLCTKGGGLQREMDGYGIYIRTV